jgi:hypothetical protein
MFSKSYIKQKKEEALAVATDKFSKYTAPGAEFEECFDAALTTTLEERDSTRELFKPYEARVKQAVLEVLNTNAKAGLQKAAIEFVDDHFFEVTEGAIDHNEFFYDLKLHEQMADAVERELGNVEEITEKAVKPYFYDDDSNAAHEEIALPKDVAS